MIYKKKTGKYTVFIKDNDRFYENILHDFLSYRINITKLLRSEDETKVWLISTERGPMIIKLYIPKTKKLERVLKSLVKRDFYESLIYKTNNAVNRGANFINDIYLLAQKKVFNYAYVHIILMEYIEGTQIRDLEPISDDLKKEIKGVIEKLHTYNMVSGAPHKENTMLTKDGIKLIDLSGKNCTSVTRAIDRIELEKYIGIKNDNFDLGYYVFVYRKKLKRLLKDIKIKLGLRKK